MIFQQKIMAVCSILLALFGHRNPEPILVPFWNHISMEKVPVCCLQKWEKRGSQNKPAAQNQSWTGLGAEGASAE